ncbi:CD3324 family protein [Metabacillus sp. RGM 3146]|uniref:CD3324 family protein n=1 Tax=Metabacillus sp. RGM 3146 TaxID=3401092 RepID=UPI003B9922D8
MKYANAAEILPERLISEIQQYIQGETLYIPKPKENRQKWGTLSGIKKALAERNGSIKEAYRNGQTIHQLAEEYYLSIETIKKIVYSKKTR